ncbi:MAG: adenylosuccinate synthase [Verrucomicrobia bacterium]|nr:adenylosuccinate synthase [Verrucomicrobiota bacterium]
MSNTILVGAQWGDEGKGKIIDYLTHHADVVVRTQGGNNAGHTIVHGSEKYVLSLIPSGILHRGKVCVLGNGVVIDPVALLGEIDALAGRGIACTPENLLISDRAHVVFPYHRVMDAFREDRKKGRIGTTKRGIGPAYGDKIARTGLRMIDLAKPARVRAAVLAANQLLKQLGAPAIKAAAVVADYEQAWKRLQPHVTDTVGHLHAAMKKKRRILFEGAQGTYLDIDHGTYPYVTSSSTTSGGACTGSGVPPNKIDSIYGVMKAYTTRVGEGPFPTENAELSDRLHDMGREFGAVTGRARRCGWLDAVATRAAVQVNGVDRLAITNLDGLDGQEVVRICVAYELDGQELQRVPADVEDLARCVPVYRDFPGWKTSTEEVRKFTDLPKAAQRYLKAVEKLCGAPLELISVGPGRHQTFHA